ncbi:bifunctional 3-demethylubiquinone-9 3-methyltransferase/ 2-octaprenyl-6-hydroxy phenol methylase, partial [Dimargaris cristalligena]
SSVSPEEIAKFSRLSSEWWAPEGHFQMLHQMNSARVDYIRHSSPQRATFSPHPESLVRPFRGLHMLDVGCGGGLLCEALARLGGQVTGIDATYDNIQIARVHAQKDPQLANSEASLDYFHTTAEDIQQTGQQFDVVTSMEVIEHVMHPDQFVTNLFSLTKPGGLVFMSTISRTPLAYALTILGAERLLGLVPSGTHDYQKYIRPDELRAMVEPSGRVVDLRGIWYHPTAARWQVMDPTLLGRLGTQVNYIMVAQKP